MQVIKKTTHTFISRGKEFEVQPLGPVLAGGVALYVHEGDEVVYITLNSKIIGTLELLPWVMYEGGLMCGLDLKPLVVCKQNRNAVEKDSE